MGTKSPEGRMPKGEELKLLAKDLGTETSPRTILARLKALKKALSDADTLDQYGLVFLRAGGLLAVIQILRGSSASGIIPNPDHPSDAMPLQAAIILERLLSSAAVKAELSSPTAAILPLVAVLRDAPSTLGRCLACQGLMTFLPGQQAHRRAMVEAGVVGLVLALYVKMWHSPVGQPLMDPAMRIARVLVCSETAAVQELGRAMQSPDKIKSFGALLILMGTLTGDLPAPAAFGDAGIVDILVATLDHESPHCVAAAAGILYVMESAPGGNPAMVAASDAIPALIRVIARARPPGDPALDKGLYQRILFQTTVAPGQTESVYYSNPTALASLALGQLCIKKLASTLDSFLAAGGVATLVHALKKSTCPLTLKYNVASLAALLEWLFKVPKPRKWIPDPADSLFEAGLCQAALRVLKKREKSLHEDMLILLVRFFKCLSDQTFAAAMAVLVPGGIVELSMTHMAKAGQCEAGTGTTLFMYFLRNMGSGERLCTPSVVDQLMKWFMRWFPEADGSELIRLSILLDLLLKSCRCYIPAAIKANVIPSLVRTLRKISGNQWDATGPDDLINALDAPLDSLDRLMLYDKEDAGGHWKSAMDAGILPLLAKLFPLVDAPRTCQLLRLSDGVLRLAPARAVARQGPAVVRAVARLLAEDSAMVTRPAAAEALLTIGMRHPELLIDCHTWGIEVNVEQLTTHSDPALAAKAGALKTLVVTHETIGSCGEKPIPFSASASSPSPDPAEDPLSKTPVACPGRRVTGKVWACAGCGITAEAFENGKLKDCSGCRSVRYCGKACQTADWPVHKPTCKRLQRK